MPIARFLRDGTAQNERDADKATRAVVMIDPFPEAPDFSTDPAPPPVSLTSVGGQLITALKNQARFKPDEAAAAASEDGFYSRYLIAPSRSEDKPAAVVQPIGDRVAGWLWRIPRPRLPRSRLPAGPPHLCQRFLMEHFCARSEKSDRLGDADAQKSFWGAGAYQEAAR